MAPRSITVNAIGFLDKDRRMIRNILSVASNKDYSYQLAIASGEVAEVVIVNADDPVAMTMWNDYRQATPDAQVILASTVPQFATDYTCIKRPLIASQLHSVLAPGGQARMPEARAIQKYEVLAKSFLFRNLSTVHLEKIVGLSRVMLLPAQQVVFEAAASGEEMFVVLNGRLKVSITNRDGREIILGAIGPGEIVGEIAMLDGRGRSATATTLTPCELLVIHRHDFMPFLEQNPKAAIDLIKVLALRLRLNTEQLAELIDEDEILS
ncbi:MAG: cyclic nucleotide-binding domain-containing protein [Candidatus Contendobacter sp.]|nr:cyclic nucleotide-binding domain-containing protein [Candidatus Contendobacter sp.]